MKDIGSFVGLQPFDWSQCDFDPINAGTYDDQISEEARVVLMETFEPEIKGLEELTGIKFG